MNSPFVSKYGVSHPLDLRIKKEGKKQFIWWMLFFFFFFNEVACIPDLTPTDTLSGHRFLKDTVGCLVRGHTPQQALCVHFLS